MPAQLLGKQGLALTMMIKNNISNAWVLARAKVEVPSAWTLQRAGPRSTPTNKPWSVRLETGDWNLLTRSLVWGNELGQPLAAPATA